MHKGIFMKSLLLLLPVAFATFSGCTASDTDNEKFTFIQGEYSYEKNESKYTSQSMYKFNNETGEAWRMSFKNSKWIWVKIETTE
jgi:hypothetical protein